MKIKRVNTVVPVNRPGTFDSGQKHFDAGEWTLGRGTCDDLPGVWAERDGETMLIPLTNIASIEYAE